MKIQKFCLFLIVTMLVGMPAGAKVWINPPVTQPGETFGVYLDDPNILSAMVTFQNKDIPFFLSKEKESTWRALVPVALEQKPGDYPLIVNVQEPDDRLTKYEGEITIGSRKFDRVAFNLPAPKKKLLRQVLIVDEWAEIEAELLKDLPVQSWEGSFMKPCPGITSLSYGSFELINNETKSRHRGMDIYNAKEENTNIKAANKGEIAVAKEYNAFGKTVVINHGQRVFSLYFHLSKIYVQKGETVKKGAVIGKMGSTGISTAPHLHFAISVDNQRVDPEQWFSQEF